MIIKILNNTTPYGKIMASHEGSLHSSTLRCNQIGRVVFNMTAQPQCDGFKTHVIGP